MDGEDRNRTNRGREEGKKGGWGGNKKGQGDTGDQLYIRSVEAQSEARVLVQEKDEEAG